MEKIYGLVIYARRAYDLRAEDLPISTLSFLKLSDDAAHEKESLSRIMKDIESILKPFADKLTKIKSSSG